MIETERQAEFPPPAGGMERRRNVASLPPGSPGDAQLARERSAFADSARFWSMLAIVALHSTGAVTASSHSQPVRVALDLCKFGSINFFLISGFLLGPMFETGRPWTIIRRRLEKILLPWSAWYMLALASFVVGGLLRHSLLLGLSFRSLEVIGSCAVTIATQTSYWFVPNLFFSTCLLLAMRKHLRSLWLGGCLLLLTLFYALNIYANWIPSSHTTALGGYVFFLWLGSLWSRQYAWISARLQKTSFVTLSLLVAFLLFLSILESNLIERYFLSDPGNTLRISNQLYALAVALLIMKFKSSSALELLDIRNNLFGVYLTHWVILGKVVKLCALTAGIFPVLSTGHGSFVSLLEALLLTIVVFTLSLCLTRLLRSSRRSAWLVGDQSRRVLPPQDLAVHQQTGILISAR